MGGGGGGGAKKKRIKALFFRAFFFNISRKNSKTSNVNVKSLNTLSLKIWTGQSLFNSVTLKNTKTEPQKFFSTKQ